MTPPLTPASRAASPLPRTMPSAQQRQHPFARARSGAAAADRKANADALALRPEMLRPCADTCAAQCRASLPCNSPPSRQSCAIRAQRRRMSFFLDVPEPVVEPAIWASDFPPTPRRSHRARRAARKRCHRGERQASPAPGRNSPVERHRDQNIDNTFGHKEGSLSEHDLFRKTGFRFPASRSGCPDS